MYNLMKMKKSYPILLSLFLGTIIIFCSCYNSKNDGADAYCDSLIEIEDNVITQVDSFFQSIRFRHYSTQEHYDKTQQILAFEMNELKRIGDFKQDNSLHTALWKILTTIDKMLQEEGKEIVALDEQLLKKYDKTKVDKLDNIENVAILKIQKVQQLFDSVQVNFLTKYGFDIELDSLSYIIKDNQE